jgi:FlaA1/EpsC-like NDP-sugar epimerase
MQVLWIYYVSTAFLGLSSHLMYNSVASIPKIVLYTLEILRLRKRNIVSWPAIKTQHKGTKENPYHTLIIGAGFSGIGMAKRLKEEGMHDFVIVERGDDIGGTWYFNTYPNCACVCLNHKTNP